MTNAEHTKLLDMYLSRVSIADLEKIVEARKKCAFAALSPDMSLLVAQAQRTQAAGMAIENMIQWDRDMIAQGVKNLMSDPQ